MFECKKCSKCFAYISELEKHKLSRADCSYSLSIDQIRNITRAHNDGAYYCEYCKKGFSKKSNLSRHQHIHQSKEKLKKDP